MENVKINMADLFDKFDWRYSEDAIDTIVDTWANNKNVLIEALKGHPNYVDGKFLIAMDNTFTRVKDADAISEFANWVRCECAQDTEYRNALPDDFTIESVDWYIDREPLRRSYKQLPSGLAQFFGEHWIARMEQYIPDTFYEMCKEICPNAHISKGSKTTKALGKLFKYLGYDKHPDYNRRFAKFADAINPLAVVRHTILSVNPLDYLTMSFGNSWSSCHTIDKLNRRRMPNGYRGQYCSGTMSYMLDGVSMVFYTVEQSYDGDEFYGEPKTSRQMFHYADGRLVQGRLYPNYDDKDVIKANREIVESIISTCFGFDNMWVKKDRDNIYNVTRTHGTHYADYTQFNRQCNYSVVKNYEHEELYMDIGHDPICIECGEEHRDSETINCCNGQLRCENCGDRLDEDDVIWIDDEPYCNDCVFYCEDCGNYHLNDEAHEVSNGRYTYLVCDYCYENNYFECEICGDVHHQDECCWVESECIEVCPDCLADYFSNCDDCGELVRNGELETFGNSSVCSDCAERRRESEEE